MLPEMDGLEALQKIKVKDPEIVVVMITGNLSVENVQKSIQLDASRFVVKPFKSANLLKALNDAWQTAKPPVAARKGAWRSEIVFPFAQCCKYRNGIMRLGHPALCCSDNLRFLAAQKWIRGLLQRDCKWYRRQTLGARHGNLVDALAQMAVAGFDR